MVIDLRAFEQNEIDRLHLVMKNYIVFFFFHISKQNVFSPCNNVLLFINSAQINILSRTDP